MAFPMLNLALYLIFRRPGNRAVTYYSLGIRFTAFRLLSSTILAYI